MQKFTSKVRRGFGYLLRRDLAKHVKEAIDRGAVGDERECLSAAISYIAENSEFKNITPDDNWKVSDVARQFGGKGASE